jgi:hypothetical protein
MRNRHSIKYSLITLLLIIVLAGCGVIDQRLADGTAVAAGKDAGALFGEGDEPIGQGGGTDPEDTLSPAEIATALAETLAAVNTSTPKKPSATPIIPPTQAEKSATPIPSPTATEEGAPTPTVPGYQFTALAQTLTSMVTTPEGGQETETPDENDDGESITATPTVSPTPEPIPENICNSFRFVAHVSYPNGSVVQPETYFYKSWQVQNTGTCTWNSRYSLVFYDGFQLGGISPLEFGGTVLVSPEQYVTLTVHLYTPPQPGTYNSYWLLRDSEGHLFGGGENGDEPLVVSVVVPGESAPIYTDPITTAPPFTPGP